MNEDRIPGKWIFWFVVYTTTLVFVYVGVVTFLPIPEKNVRFVDTAFGFLLGSVLGTGIGYLLTGSPEKKLKEPLPGTTTQETIVASKTTETP